MAAGNVILLQEVVRARMRENVNDSAIENQRWHDWSSISHQRYRTIASQHYRVIALSHSGSKPRLCDDAIVNQMAISGFCIMQFPVASSHHRSLSWHYEAIARCAIAMTRWCVTDDAMLHRVIVSSLSRHRHCFVATSHASLKRKIASDSE